MQKMSTCSLHQLLSDFQSDREWFTSHVFWEVEINEFATASNARMFFAQFWHMQSQKQWSSHTNSHYVIFQCERSYLLSKRSNSRSSESTHARESLSRKFSISIHVSRFSKISHSIQFADAVKSISSSICLVVGSHRSSRESKAVKYSWESLSWKSIDLKKSQKLLFSNFSLVTFLLWKSHYFEEVLDRVYLFLLLSFALTLIWERSFLRKFSMLLFYCLLVSRSVIVYSILLWRSHWSKKTKSCSLLFCWFVEIWLFFFVVASSWFSTITHLLSTLCDSLSNDKYERERIKKNDQTWQEEKQDAWQYRFGKRTVQLQQQQWVCFNDVSLVSLL